MQYDFLVPQPQKIDQGKTVFKRPSMVKIIAKNCEKHAVEMLKKDLRSLSYITISDKAPFTISLSKTKTAAQPESYKLKMNSKGITVTANDDSGIYYATQTLLQIFVLAEVQHWRALSIQDWPEYKLRSFMIDMGRAVFPLPLIKRIIRIMARLKMNLLHLHINDDQLNSLKFNKLPLGSENPQAITLAQLKSLIVYARKYHISVMPEIECWGHAGSIIHHYPKLYGAPGMWGGMSFGMGEETFDLFEKIFDELIPVLEKDCLVHVGLDEAIWALLDTVPPEKEKDYSPTLLVKRIDDILDRAGKKHNKNITTHMWADHGGRPLPKTLKLKTVVAPWMYFEEKEDDIKSKIQKYGGKNKRPFMMGGGMSNVHFGGHFGATRLWCQHGRKYSNNEGITICFWEANDLAEKLIGLYGGADHAWSPDSPAIQGIPSDRKNEYLYSQVALRMRKWQAKFKDADTEAINKDRGPEIYRGFYCWGELAGKPVAPTSLTEIPDHGGVDDIKKDASE